MSGHLAPLPQEPLYPRTIPWISRYWSSYWTRCRPGGCRWLQALERLRTLPFEDLGFARVDHHRQLRQGFPEVVFAAGKSLEQIRGILASLSPRADHILVTRLSPDKVPALRRNFPRPSITPIPRC